MKTSRFSEEQISYALRQVEAGTKVPDICRQPGISQATFYGWKSKFGCMGVAELRRLRLLEQENAHLKKLVADLSLDKQMLQDVIKKAVKPAATKHLVQHMTVAYHVSVKRACRVQPTPRSSLYYQAHKRDETLLAMRMREIAYPRVRYGFRRVEIMLRREVLQITTSGCIVFIASKVWL